MTDNILDPMRIRFIGKASDGTEQWFVPLTQPDKDGKQIGTICDNSYGLIRIRNPNILTKESHMPNDTKTLTDLLDCIEEAVHQHILADLVDGDMDYQCLDDIAEVFAELYPERMERAESLAQQDAEEMGIDYEEDE